MVFLRSSERDPVFNGVARRSARFIPFPGWTLFFSTVLSRLLGGFGVFFSIVLPSNSLWYFSLGTRTSFSIILAPISNGPTLSLEAYK